MYHMWWGGNRHRVSRAGPGMSQVSSLFTLSAGTFFVFS